MLTTMTMIVERQDLFNTQELGDGWKQIEHDYSIEYLIYGAKIIDYIISPRVDSESKFKKYINMHVCKLWTIIISDYLSKYNELDNNVIAFILINKLHMDEISTGKDDLVLNPNKTLTCMDDLVLNLRQLIMYAGNFIMDINIFNKILLLTETSLDDLYEYMEPVLSKKEFEAC